MKILYLWLALILFGHLSHAQDWRPIADTNNIYSYLDCERDQLFWLKADSSKQETDELRKELKSVKSELGEFKSLKNELKRSRNRFANQS